MGTLNEARRSFHAAQPFAALSGSGHEHRVSLDIFFRFLILAHSSPASGYLLLAPDQTTVCVGRLTVRRRSGRLNQLAV
jgi:hypothetical protein